MRMLGREYREPNQFPSTWNKFHGEGWKRKHFRSLSGTLKRFKAAFSSLEAFMQHKKVEDIKLRELNHKFITDYEFFLKTVRNVEHNTAMGIIKKLKKIVRIGVAK